MAPAKKIGATSTLLPQEWFARDALIIARELLGKIIEYKNCSGMIVETEAYVDDEASHAFVITPRSKIMLETYGAIYVYFTYGNHYCLNITTNQGAKGAVLIRALEPLSGIDLMQRRRNTEIFTNLTSGPGKLCQALGITTTLNNTPINEKIKISEYKNFADSEVAISPRIGIKKAVDLPWRFFVRENPFVSKNFQKSKTS